MTAMCHGLYCVVFYLVTAVVLALGVDLVIHYIGHSANFF